MSYICVVINRDYKLARWTFIVYPLDYSISVYVNSPRCGVLN